MNRPPTTDNAPSGALDRLLDAPLAVEIEFLTARARALGSARANALLQPLDLRVRSYAVLSLACSGAAPSQRDLAEFLLLDPGQIVALLDGLEQRGLVKRETDPQDRRSKVIRGTAKGRSLLAEAAEATARAEEQSLADLTSAERDQLRELLRRVAFQGR
ncbi:MarR family winged helix-turn-helix transcriptional regulator [Pseudarthrobacter sp. YS3]|jgi:DNA-binding MarR family transcriptional regulator|uniref:MarR family winged helix-turn-helix transcriptional regulator n=1 Tax=Pseudarthrobacter sp. YS3 TaxID=3453718 RepID=UPI003EEAFE5B